MKKIIIFLFATLLNTVFAGDAYLMICEGQVPANAALKDFFFSRIIVDDKAANVYFEDYSITPDGKKRLYNVSLEVKFDGTNEDYIYTIEEAHDIDDATTTYETYQVNTYYPEKTIPISKNVYCYSRD